MLSLVTYGMGLYGMTLTSIKFLYLLPTRYGAGSARSASVVGAYCRRGAQSHESVQRICEAYDVGTKYIFNLIHDFISFLALKGDRCCSE